MAPTPAKTVGQEEELAGLAKTVEQEEELAGLAKTVGQDEELAGLAKALPAVSWPLAQRRDDDGLQKGQNGGCGPGCGCALCSAEREDTPAPTVSRAALEVVESGSAREPASVPGNDLLAKATLAVQAGATPSLPLDADDYGLTFPEKVDVEISATKSGATWSPKVKKLTGHYSKNIRLLAGQEEITGPGGNTKSGTFCAQCANLAKLGNITGNKWYVIAAVSAHEEVHATRFKPALEDAETAITTAIEAVTVPHTDPMTEAEAITKLQADAAFKAAVTNAQKLWLAKILTRVAGDHAAGGPTDTAEKTVTEPLRTTICDHAKKQKWPACASCP